MGSQIDVASMCREAQDRVIEAIQHSVERHLQSMHREEAIVRRQRAAAFDQSLSEIRQSIERAQVECNVNPMLANAYFSTIGQRQRVTRNDN